MQLVINNHTLFHLCGHFLIEIAEVINYFEN